MKVIIENHHSHDYEEFEGNRMDVEDQIIHKYPWLEGAHDKGDLMGLLEDLNSTQMYSVVGIVPEEGEQIEQDDPFFDQDYMVPDIGNLHSYRKFVSQDHKGFHIYLVSDAVKEVLEKDGVKDHNDVTIAISRMINDAASLPDEQGKTFRIGHDSYYVYFPSYEASLQFLHNLDSLVRELPTLYSKHPYFDVGIGDDIENAYHALTQVEQMKSPEKEGNHVLIHTDHVTKYISPDDIF